MTEAQLLDGDAFNRLVLENDLAGKTWEQDGYIYAGLKGVAGWELYRTYGPKWRWLYTARRVCTNANAAGGAIVIDIAVPTGVTAQLVALNGSQATTGTRILVSYLVDEDFATLMNLAYIATAAGSSFNIPSIGATAGATGNLGDSLMLRVGPAQALSVQGGGATGVANDTVTVGISLLMSSNVEPTWSVARSTNAANCTLAASTVSAANTLQAVLIV